MGWKLWRKVSQEFQRDQSINLVKLGIHSWRTRQSSLLPICLLAAEKLRWQCCQTWSWPTQHCGALQERSRELSTIIKVSTRSYKYNYEPSRIIDHQWPRQRNCWPLWSDTVFSTSPHATLSWARRVIWWKASTIYWMCSKTKGSATETLSTWFDLRLLSRCHWNENHDRPCTSRWRPKSYPRALRSKTGKKNCVRGLYIQVQGQVWDRHIAKLFKNQ